MSARTSRRGFLKALSLASLSLLFGEQLRLVEKAQSATQKSAPNVLILLFDALSARHMSLHGYHRETTPHLKRFAEKATVYHRHYAAGNFTAPGTASLLTGTYPWSHRAYHLGGRLAQEYQQRNLFRAFDGGVFNRIAYTHNRFADYLLGQFGADLDVYIPLQELCIFDGRISSRLFPNDAYVADRAFQDLILDDWQTPSSLFLSRVDNKGRPALEKVLMREYQDLFPRGIPYAHGKLDYILEHAIDRIVDIGRLARSSGRPFLGYFHLFPPHDPYRTRREFVDRFDDGWASVAKPPHFFSEDLADEDLNWLRRQYDEFILYADAEFGRLYDLMDQVGLLENTYVVVTSDHGELFERGVWEHLTPMMYEPLIHIPLLISKPRQAGREDVYTPTSCIDLLPTLLHTTGQPIPDWCEGEILPAFTDQKDSSGRSIFSVEAKTNPKRGPLTKGTVVLIKDQYKLIRYFGYAGYDDEYELYDVMNDPEEMEDLYPSRASIVAELQDELEEKLRTVNEL